MKTHNTRPQTIFESLEEQLAFEHRRVVSVWRAMVLLQRSFHNVPAEQRRWKAAPVNLAETQTVLHRLRSSGHLEGYQDLPSLYRVTSPYARQSPIEEHEILMELHPYAAISHLSALAFHGLTDQFPREIHITTPSGRSSRILPVGIGEKEWFSGLSEVSGSLPSHVEDLPIRRHQLDKYFGFAEYSPNGYPVRVMTMEKTLIDGLRTPEWCGGISNVLQGWLNAKDAIKLSTVLEFTEHLNVRLLKQRVGFVLEELGFSDPQLDEWAVGAKRGGSSKLVGNSAFAPSFSDRWKLSLNASLFPLGGGDL